MSKLQLPFFQNYEEEATFWDNLDTSDLMESDEEWFQFETPTKRAIRVAILPDIANQLAARAHEQGVSVETLVNILLVQQLQRSALAD